MLFEAISLIDGLQSLRLALRAKNRTKAEQFSPLSQPAHSLEKKQGGALARAQMQVINGYPPHHHPVPPQMLYLSALTSARHIELKMEGQFSRYATWASAPILTKQRNPNCKWLQVAAEVLVEALAEALAEPPRSDI